MSYNRKYQVDSIKIDQFIEKCVGCGLCMKGCPMADIFEKHPEKVIKDISQGKKNSLELSFNCTLCGYCSQVCPHGADLMGIMRSLRKYSCEDLSKKKNLKFTTIDIFQKASFSSFFTTDAIYRKSERKGDYLFFPGCSLISTEPDMVMSIWEYLCSSHTGTGIMLQCCGAPSKMMGQDEKFQHYWSQVKKQIANSGAKKIILACPHCISTIKDLPDGVTTTSIWEFINQEGLPDDIQGKYSGEKIWLHDPCQTRNEDKIHQYVRDIAVFLGLDVMEFPYNREKALCCGKGGMVGVLHPDRALKWSENLKKNTEGKIISYCQSCVESFGSESSSHLLSLIFGGANDSSASTLKRWTNRLLLKSKINKSQ